MVYSRLEIEVRFSKPHQKFYIFKLFRTKYHDGPTNHFYNVESTGKYNISAEANLKSLSLWRRDKEVCKKEWSTKSLIMKFNFKLRHFKIKKFFQPAKHVDVFYAELANLRCFYVSFFNWKRRKRLKNLVFCFEQSFSEASKEPLLNVPVESTNQGQGQGMPGIAVVPGIISSSFYGGIEATYYDQKNDILLAFGRINVLKVEGMAFSNKWLFSVISIFGAGQNQYVFLNTTKFIMKKVEAVEIKGEGSGSVMDRSNVSRGLGGSPLKLNKELNAEGAPDERVKKMRYKFILTVYREASELLFQHNLLFDYREMSLKKLKKSQSQKSSKSKPARLLGSWRYNWADDPARRAKQSGLIWMDSSQKFKIDLGDLTSLKASDGKLIGPYKESLGSFMIFDWVFNKVRNRDDLRFLKISSFRGKKLCNLNLDRSQCYVIKREDYYDEFLVFTSINQKVLYVKRVETKPLSMEVKLDSKELTLNLSNFFGAKEVKSRLFWLGKFNKFCAYFEEYLMITLVEDGCSVVRFVKKIKIVVYDHLFRFSHFCEIPVDLPSEKDLQDVNESSYDIFDAKQDSALISVSKFTSKLKKTIKFKVIGFNIPRGSERIKASIVNTRTIQTTRLALQAKEGDLSGFFSSYYLDQKSNQFFVLSNYEAPGSPNIHIYDAKMQILKFKFIFAPDPNHPKKVKKIEIRGFIRRKRLLIIQVTDCYLYFVNIDGGDRKKQRLVISHHHFHTFWPEMNIYADTNLLYYMNFKEMEFRVFRNKKYKPFGGIMGKLKDRLCVRNQRSVLFFPNIGFWEQLCELEVTRKRDV